MQEQDGIVRIYDILRHRYVALTPEEWVRQHFIHYLIEHKSYPANLLTNEKTIHVNGMKRRCDTIIYSHQATPLCIVEYKAPSIEISQEVFMQICAYNVTLHVPYLIVSNGLKHFCCRIDYLTGNPEFQTDIPEFQSLER